MALDSVPNPQRHPVTPKIATGLPGAPSAEATIIKRLKNGDLDGAVKHGKHRSRYLVYADQFHTPPPPHPPRTEPADLTALRAEKIQLLARIEQLQTENATHRHHLETLDTKIKTFQAQAAYLETELATANENNRELHGSLGALIDATTDIRKGAAHFQAGAGDFHNANENLFKMINSLTNALGQQLYPNNISNMGFPDQPAP